MALVLCQVGLHACMHGMRVAVPLQALALGYSAMTVGVLVAMFAIVPALLSIAFGRFTDRAGYHAPVRLAAGLSITAGVSLALSESLFALCLGAACSGAGSGFGMIAIQRTASKMATSGASRLQVFSWIALAPSAAGLLGPLLGGSLIDIYGYRYAFAALGSLPLLTLLLSQLVPRETSGGSGDRKAAPRGRILDLLAQGPMRRLLFINWVVVASWDAHGFVIPILGHERGFSATAVGGVFAAFGAASIVVRLLIPLLSRWLSARLLMQGSVALAALAFAIYPLLPSAGAMAMCAFAFGLALGAVQPSILTTLHDVTPGDRHGEALALRSTFTQSSMLVMPLLFGAVGASLGAGVLLWVMAALLGAGSWQVQRLFAPTTAALASADLTEGQKN
nr:MFS transporter [Pseudomaricurvus alcaniphilus]